MMSEKIFDDQIFSLTITVGGDPPSLIPTSKFYPGYYLTPHPPTGQTSILKFYLALVLLVGGVFLAYFGLIRPS